jgi:Sulfotransferase family
MIFHDQKAIFFHVGKAGGTAVEYMLMPNHQLDPMVANTHLLFGLDRQLGIYLQHASCKLTQEIVGADIFEEYFKFTIVRNPYTRMVSAYYYLYEFHRNRYGSFRDYILALPSQINDPVLLRGSHVISQSHYTHIDGRQSVDYIGRFEQLDLAAMEISNNLSLSAQLPRVKFPRVAQRPAGDGWELYDEDTIAVIQEVYALDFELYGYPKVPAETCRAK